jgi:DNA-binding HxlR family transcriptional regulator
MAASDDPRPQAARGGRSRRTPQAQAGQSRERRADPDRSLRRIDRLVHERLRLGILSALAVNESLAFNDLKALLQATDGNLSVHARKLEEADYISCTKRFEDRVPRTEYRLTANGRRALTAYLDRMEALIRTMRER